MLNECLSAPAVLTRCTVGHHLAPTFLTEARNILLRVQPPPTLSMKVSIPLSSAAPMGRPCAKLMTGDAGFTFFFDCIKDLPSGSEITLVSTISESSSVDLCVDSDTANAATCLVRGKDGSVVGRINVQNGSISCSTSSVESCYGENAPSAR